MPEWLPLALPAVQLVLIALQVGLLLRVRSLQGRVSRDQQRIARDLAELETYRPVIAAIEEHDADCTAYQATQLILALLALRLGATFEFGE